MPCTYQVAIEDIYTLDLSEYSNLYTMTEKFFMNL